MHFGIHSHFKAVNSNKSIATKQGTNRGKAGINGMANASSLCGDTGGWPGSGVTAALGLPWMNSSPPWDLLIFVHTLCHIQDLLFVKGATELMEVWWGRDEDDEEDEDEDVDEDEDEEDAELEEPGMPGTGQS
ncbi:hypothetical protein TURU_126623 [Turdus rufiventris]|nr:hypothetical protein TURU_126623 [Turdus rufiventris]